MIHVARFLNSFTRFPAAGTVEEEVSLPVGDSVVPASYIRPVGRGRIPGWIVLHGITVPGRRHPMLIRFAHSLAASGGAVLIPEVPAWRQLRLDMEAGDATIAASVEYLRKREDVESGALNLVGFSFGATQALMSASLPGIRESVRSVVGFGGYSDIGRTLHCMVTGEHEWQGVMRQLDPDPYGRWILAANYLRKVPEFADMERVATEAYSLAVASGETGVYAADPIYDALKAQARSRLPTRERELWDLIAPPSGATPAVESLRELSRKLVDAVIAAEAGIDPTPRLASLDQKIVLAHGYDDRLIPFTESLRLRSVLPDSARANLTITRLFAHSREAGRLRYLEYPGEFGRYLLLLNRALRSG